MKLYSAIASTVLALALGIALGYPIWRTEPVETQVIPAATLKEISQRGLVEFCVHSAVFSELVKPVDIIEGVRVQKVLRGLQMFASPLSDRGAICTVKASIITRRTQQNGNAVESSRDTQLTYLVAINGDSEVVTEEFAKALLGSQVIQVLASNLGNDGTIVPQVKVAF